MLLILLVIFAILFEVIIIGWLGLKLRTKSKNIKVSVKPISYAGLPRIKTNVIHPQDSIYSTGTNRERPIKHSDGDLIPYGLSDQDRELLEMFYDKNI